MRAIVTKYHGPCATRGALVVAKDGDGNRVVVPYDSLTTQGPYVHAAITLCHKMGWTGTLVQGGLGDGKEVFVFANVRYADGKGPGETAYNNGLLLGGIKIPKFRKG